MGSCRRLKGLVLWQFQQVVPADQERIINQQYLHGTAKADANTAITSAGFIVGTVSTQNTDVSADVDKVRTALTDTSLEVLGTAINYTINSPFFPPYFPPYFPPSFCAPTGCTPPCGTATFTGGTVCGGSIQAGCESGCPGCLSGVRRWNLDCYSYSQQSCTDNCGIVYYATCSSFCVDSTVAASCCPA